MITELEKIQIYVKVMEGVFLTLHSKLLKLPDKSKALFESKSKKKSFDKKKAMAVLKKATDNLNSKVVRPSIDSDGIKKDEYGTDTFVLYGGLNGGGPYSKWQGYFLELSKFVAEVSKHYYIWLIKMTNDCLDDVFDAEFGIKEITEDDRELSYDSPNLLDYWEAHVGDKKK